MKPNEYSQTEYKAHKERLKTLIDIIKENNELSYNTEIELYSLLCDAYYHTNYFFLKIEEDR